MSTYIAGQQTDIVILSENMERAASLLPERYRSGGKAPIESVVDALADCGLYAFVEDGAVTAALSELDEIYSSIDDIFAALAPAVEDGSYFAYIDLCDGEPVGYFFHDGAVDVKAGRIVWD